MSEIYRKLDYAHQKLEEAVCCLATSADPLDRRLEQAIRSMRTLEDDDFTLKWRERWTRTMALVTRNEVELPSVLQKLDIQQQEGVAKSIFSLYCQIGQDVEDHRREA